MGSTIKRLSLGILLIALTSSILLVSDWNRRKPRAEGGFSGQFTKKWRLNLLHFVDAPASEESGEGMIAGLREAGLVEGRDYEIKVRNAQGDMATVNSLVDAALTEGVDLLMTLSTPTLQVAIQRARGLPIVFSLVASPILVGAGRSNEDHLPNVAGVSVMSDFDGMTAIIRECLPTVRRIGTLFVPSEANSVFYKDALVAAARKMNIEVVTVAASTSVEVADAALSLCSREIDAVCQISDNLTSVAFASIAQATKRARLPLFVFQSVQARDGAVVALARDFKDAGREAALMAARIMRGENPASIPFQNVSTTKIVVNPEAARALGLTLPPALLRRADEVIG